SRMSPFSSMPKQGGDRLRIPPVALAIGFAALVGAALILVSGHDPLSAYAEIARGSLSPGALPDTLNWATPLVGMTLAAAIPLRGGMVNLGGDGQLVIGGLIGALAPLFLPGHSAFGAAVGLALAGLRGGPLAAPAGFRGTRRRPLRRARGLGRGPARRPDADLESAPELPGDRRHILPRALSSSRRFDRTAANPHDPAGRAPLRSVRSAQRRQSPHRGDRARG